MHLQLHYIKAKFNDPSTIWNPCASISLCDFHVEAPWSHLRLMGHLNLRKNHQRRHLRLSKCRIFGAKSAPWRRGNGVELGHHDWWTAERLSGLFCSFAFVGTAWLQREGDIGRLSPLVLPSIYLSSCYSPCSKHSNQIPHPCRHQWQPPPLLPLPPHLPPWFILMIMKTTTTTTTMMARMMCLIARTMNMTTTTAATMRLWS